MTTDSLLIVIIFSGVALCGAYFRAQFVDLRKQRRAEIEEGTRTHLLYRVELSRPEKSAVVPVVVDRAANPESV